MAIGAGHRTNKRDVLQTHFIRTMGSFNRLVDCNIFEPTVVG